ncbi:unnamed protein product [Arctia plantaginis]|uniref:Uncharacterized protein n=1 Tax=Arctia plantaginis TaxID=874455 RepID=A0A8S1AVB4_ARCPL|nr:unnamed protein product [Arctia plantaginis]
MSVGKISEFKVSTGNWSSYIQVERVEMYFLANKVEEDVKLPTLITFIGEDTYELLSSLASRIKPASLKYKAAVELLQKHLQPKPSVLAERYRFRQRRQLAEEYVSVLKKLTRNCEFQMNLEENLRDQFVCGIKSEVTRQRLFAEKDIGYTQSVTLALSLEAAERDAGAVVLQSEQLVQSDPDPCGTRHDMALRLKTPSRSSNMTVRSSR